MHAISQQQNSWPAENVVKNNVINALGSLAFGKLGSILVTASNGQKGIRIFPSDGTIAGGIWQTG